MSQLYAAIWETFSTSLSIMLPCVIHTGQWSYSKALHQVLWLLVGFLPNQFPQKIQSCKIFSAFSISLEGRWAFPLLYSRGQGCPGVQGKGESSDDGDEDLEHFALTCQCLAEVWFNFGWAILPLPCWLNAPPWPPIHVHCTMVRSNREIRASSI